MGLYIGIGIGAGIILLGIIYLLLEHFVFTKKRCNKVLLDLEKKYEYLNSLLLGQDLQYIQRLELISRTNLLYNEVHANYFRRFKEIRDGQDRLYHDIITELNELFVSKKYKEFKKYYKENYVVLMNYEKSVNTLDHDLYEIIKPEEEARQNILNLKEKLRDVKSNFNSRELDILFVQNSFQLVFERIEFKLNEYDDLVDSAKYEEASELIPQINEVLNKLNEVLENASRWIREILENIPNKIDELEEKYKELLAKGFPIRTIGIEDIIVNMKYQLEQVKKNLLDLKVANIDKNLTRIYDEIHSVEDAFSEEESSKISFEENIKIINDRFSYLEKEFLKITNNLPVLKKYYVIDDTRTEQYEALREKVEEVNSAKRKLDSSILALQSITYKALVSEMNTLDKSSKELEIMINSYNEFVRSLKTDCETAYNLMDDVYLKLKKYDSYLRSFNDDKFTGQYHEIIMNCYEFLDKSNEIISHPPINVSLLNQNINSLTSTCNVVFKEIDEQMNYRHLAEKLIMICNRDRYKFNDINSSINIAEELFFNHEYKKAYEQANEAKNALKIKDGLNN